MVDILDAPTLAGALSDPDLLAEHLDRPLLCVELASLDDLDSARASSLQQLIAGAPVLVVGVERGTAEPGDRALDGACTTVVDPDDLERVVAVVGASPRAALVLDRVLRAGEMLAVSDALSLEAFGYSALLGGDELRRWLAANPQSGPPPRAGEVEVARDGDRLEIALEHPETHNAFSAAMRDALCAALDLALVDPTIASIHLRGVGPSFSSGGALWEFGTAPDPASAAAIRIARSVGARLAAVDARVHCEVHGACIGAGIELAAFADHVVAAPDTYARLPELSMGLIPGAGGTVSVARRIGRQRTAWLVLTGATLDAAAMSAWGLVDEVC